MKAHSISRVLPAQYCTMMSLRIPSRGPVSPHKTPFLQLNTYGPSVFQLLLYYAPSPYFLVLQLGKLDTVHLGQGQRCIRRSATRGRLYQVHSHSSSTWILSKEHRLRFSHSREYFKKYRANQKIAKGTRGESDSFLETWSQDFGIVVPVYMTSCTISHYLLCVDAEQQMENKMKTPSLPGLETIRMGWCHSLIQQHSKWNVVVRDSFVNTEDLV